MIKPQSTGSPELDDETGPAERITQCQGIFLIYCTAREREIEKDAVGLQITKNGLSPIPCLHAFAQILYFIKFNLLR